MSHIEKMNVYLSNLAVGNVKLHNLHWNVVGTQFVQVHEYTEEIYDDFFEKYDEVAEALKMKNEKPLVTMVDYLEKATIKEDNSDRFTVREALEVLKKDLELMKELATEIRKVADEAEDFTVVAMMEDHVAGYDKEIWFVNSMLA